MMIAIPDKASKRMESFFIPKKKVRVKRFYNRLQLSEEWMRWMIHTGQDPKANWGVSHSGLYADFT